MIFLSKTKRDTRVGNTVQYIFNYNMACFRRRTFLFAKPHHRVPHTEVPRLRENRKVSEWPNERYSPPGTLNFNMF
jgi:hypothetical protein